jgi:hypothetical protein
VFLSRSSFFSFENSPCEVYTPTSNMQGCALRLWIDIWISQILAIRRQLIEAQMAFENP